VSATFECLLESRSSRPPGWEWPEEDECPEYPPEFDPEFEEDEECPDDPPELDDECPE